LCGFVHTLSKLASHQSCHAWSSGRGWTGHAESEAGIRGSQFKLCGTFDTVTQEGAHVAQEGDPEPQAAAVEASDGSGRELWWDEGFHDALVMLAA
jgi:hypothetical protein